VLLARQELEHILLNPVLTLTPGARQPPCIPTTEVHGLARCLKARRGRVRAVPFELSRIASYLPLEGLKREESHLSQTRYMLQTLTTPGVTALDVGLHVLPHASCTPQLIGHIRFPYWQTPQAPRVNLRRQKSCVHPRSTRVSSATISRQMPHLHRFASVSFPSKGLPAQRPKIALGQPEGERGSSTPTLGPPPALMASRQASIVGQACRTSTSKLHPCGCSTSQGWGERRGCASPRCRASESFADNSVTY
jgi:hypothetical protein